VKAIIKITGKEPAYRFAGALSLIFLSTFLLFFQNSIVIKDPNNPLGHPTLASIYTLVFCISYFLEIARSRQSTHLALSSEPKHGSLSRVLKKPMS
jgi:hypothetical protein